MTPEKLTKIADTLLMYKAMLLDRLDEGQQIPNTADNAWKEAMDWINQELSVKDAGDNYPFDRITVEDFFQKSDKIISLWRNMDTTFCINKNHNQSITHLKIAMSAGLLDTHKNGYYNGRSA